MGVTKIRVVLDKPTYYPGETVTGRVEFVTDSALNIRGVEFKIKGQTKCSWYDPEKKQIQESKEININSEQDLVGGKGKDKKMKLSSGKYVYPFAVMLPYQIPSSFKSSKGEISYYVRAKINIPFSFDSKKRATFTVINPLNLNLYPNLKAPFRKETEKRFFGLLCASGRLTMAVDLPRTAFATSECIPITLEIANASNITVHAIHIYLKRKINWTAAGCKKDKEDDLQKLRAGAIKGGQSHTWTECLTIKSIDFPNLQGCSIIKISHELHIKAKISGIHFNLDLQIPITIGDIPFSDDPGTSIISLPVSTVANNIASILPDVIEKTPQTSSQRHSQWNFPPDVDRPPSKSSILVQQPQPQEPSSASQLQPATNLECSQNTLQSLVMLDSIVDDLTLLSSEITAELDELSISNDHNPEVACDTANVTQKQMLFGICLMLMMYMYS